MTSDVADAFKPGEWEFTPAVVADFDQHVRQSVPFYDTIQDTVATLSDWVAPDGAHLVDIGVSTGETLRRILEDHPARNYDLTVYDESPDMLAACREKLGSKSSAQTLTVHAGPAENGLHHHDADLTLCLFTLQFINPASRARLLADARARSRNSGVILIAEKVRPADPRWFEIGAELSWDFKTEQGIPAESIRAKARALRGAMRPGSEADLRSLLNNNGWHSATCLFRWHQWVIYGAFASSPEGGSPA